MIPLSVLFINITSGLKGFQQMKYKVYTEDIFKSVLVLALFFVFYFIGFDILGAALAYLIGFVLACALGLYYLNKSFPHLMKTKINAIPMKKKLFLFSWPLVISSYTKMVMSWTDTMALGFFKASYDVGLYNIALPTAGLIYMFAASFRYILTPVMSEMYAKRDMKELKAIYKSTCKWIFSITFPLLLLMFLFPDNVLGILFGQEAIAASNAFVILSLGYFMLSLIGSSSIMLLVIGRTKTLMFNIVVSSITNFLLNIILIPKPVGLGIIGAAVATAASLFMLSVLHIIFCYRYTKLQPFQSVYAKVIVAAIVSVASFYILIKLVIKATEWWILAGTFPLFLVFYAFLFLAMRGFDRKDIMILKTIEERIGMKSDILMKIIKKFI